LLSFVRRRAGLTLIECLFAAAILAVGIIGIFSLVPVAIRQVSTSLGATVSAAAAKNALISLQNRQLEACDYTWPPDWPPVPFATSFLNGTTALNMGGTPAGLITFPDLPTALYAYNVANPGAPIGDGRTAGPLAGPTFKVPGLQTDPAWITQASWDVLRTAANAAVPNSWPWALGQRPSYIPVPWARDFGWTATFVPVALPIGPTTQYRVQVAVWRAYRLLYDGPAAVAAGAAAMGTFGNGSQTVTLRGPAAEVARLTAMASAGSYIRLDAYGIWYKIQAISGANVTLMTPFSHPAAPLTGPVSVASNFQLMGLYEGVVTPRGLRGGLP
jgi:Flp pilus assembly pilin Flp